ncbi:hypothetical protein ACH4ZX_27825 [Streptomyces sp. NPDC020490]|uniref:hypothetical protein n=1 Tax=Streptomyces sp. NPDC020490 TaxID=3365078 RepID=UPI0037BADC27
MLFKPAGQQELEELIDGFARSYLRGHARNSPEGRAQICREISELAGRLRANGRERAVKGARRYRSVLHAALPQHARLEMDRMVAEALS